MKEEIFYKELVARYRSKKASEEELIVFFHLLKEGQLDQYLGDSFLEGEEVGEGQHETLHEIPRAARSAIWKRVAIAASIIGIVSLIALLFWARKDTPQNTGLSSTIVPKENIVFNTVTTQRGKQSQAVLPDGTRIWLNAASTLRYPPEFTGKERVVELDGECYFEVAKNPSRPFKVTVKDGVQIMVLGTHFNVHAYLDEPIKATLLEGSIQMQTPGDSAILKPGQQGYIKNSGGLGITDDVDTEEAIAWKNGLFQFSKADIVTVMRQIEKWYDVEVVFEGKIPEKQFVGKVPRDSDITEVLEILKLSNIKFRIEGKKVIVMP